jgi:hypothetical protein
MQSSESEIQNFEKIIEQFKRFVAEKNPDGSYSFNDGWLNDQEGYKKKIPDGAKKSLHIDEWEKSWIGSGKIHARVMAALNYIPRDEGNNLVDWHQKSDFDEIRNGDAGQMKKIESLLFRLYTEKNTDDELFDELTDAGALGKYYDLVSYLFFIKDPLLYLPNRPNSFQQAFDLLGDSFTFRMSGRCSWVNYLGFFTRIAKIRELLAPAFDENVSLIDAHSFCWVIAHNPQIVKTDLISAPSEGARLCFNPPYCVSTDDSLKPRGVRKFNPVTKKQRMKEELRNGQIGDSGELYVLNAEKKILDDSGRSDLAAMVSHVAKVDGDGKGYDIQSFSPNGQVKFIEVKTTTGKKNSRFMISDTELAFSTENPDNYYLYRLYDFKASAKENSCSVIHGNMREKLVLYPIQFTALPKEHSAEMGMNLS